MELETSDTNSPQIDNDDLELLYEEEEEVDEINVLKIINEKVKEKEKTRGDGDSVATTKVDDIERMRMGLMITIPSSKEPENCISLLLQIWFNKV